MTAADARSATDLPPFPKLLSRLPSTPATGPVRLHGRLFELQMRLIYGLASPDDLLGLYVFFEIAALLARGSEDGVRAEEAMAHAKALVRATGRLEAVPLSELLDAMQAAEAIWKTHMAEGAALAKRMQKDGSYAESGGFWMPEYEANWEKLHQLFRRRHR